MVSWSGALHAQSAPIHADRSADASAAAADGESAADQAQPHRRRRRAPAAQQPPATPTPNQAQTPDQTPDAKTATPSATDSQTFTGTVVKSGDKYVLKDDAGHTYDIDHQVDVKKFEGKRVKVQGTLDATGTMIQVK